MFVEEEVIVVKSACKMKGFFSIEFISRSVSFLFSHTKVTAGNQQEKENRTLGVEQVIILLKDQSDTLTCTRAEKQTQV